MSADAMGCYATKELSVVNYRIIVGADEAGYGPNLGPLLIAASAWVIPADLTTEEFSVRMAETFSPAAWRSGCEHVPLGDSKLLYQPASGLTTLEAGLLAMINLLHPSTLDLESLVAAVQFLDATNPDSYPSILTEPKLAPWYAGLSQFAVPTQHTCGEVERLATIADAQLRTQDIKLLGVRALIISEASFNAQVERLGSKGQLLSAATLQLVRSFCDPSANVEVFCDRQGGRKNYMPILLDAFPDAWFAETGRSNERCSYRTNASPSHEFHFTVGGDKFAPTALASMLCKYLRERLMESFNKFWANHLPQLRPTAGYPLDAKRFRDEIETTAKKLKLDPSLWWRNR